MNTLEKARRSTSARIRSCELPQCFALATAASEAHIIARPKSKRRLADRADLRRLADHARRLGER